MIFEYELMFIKKLDKLAHNEITEEEFIYDD